MERIGKIINSKINNPDGDPFWEGVRKNMKTFPITFEVQGKPLAKQSVKFTRSGMRYISKHIIEYSNWVKLSFTQAYKDFTPLETPLRVRLDVAFEIPKSLSKKKKSEALQGILKPVVIIYQKIF